jgi:mono/diheme cytochrome c family protein
MLAFFLATAAPATAQNLELGRAVYVEDCANCHGEIEYPGGPVDPERGAFPPYYAGNSYLLNVSPANIRAAILYGVTGTGMTGWGGDLSNEALDSLIGYIEYIRWRSQR